MGSFSAVSAMVEATLSHSVMRGVTGPQIACPRVPYRTYGAGRLFQPGFLAETIGFQVFAATEPQYTACSQFWDGQWPTGHRCVSLLMAWSDWCAEELPISDKNTEQWIDSTRLLPTSLVAVELVYCTCEAFPYNAKVLCQRYACTPLCARDSSQGIAG